MKPHHQRALDKAKERLLELYREEILAIFVGGSIAKGIEREDSDVDLIVVIGEDDYAKRMAEGKVSFLWHDVADYKDGYVEGRFLSKAFLEEARDRGSEPTRHSFSGVFPVFCIDDEIEALAPQIAIYPEQSHNKKIISFLAQMQLNRWFFWHEGIRKNDRYLQLRAATDMVLFGCRLIIARNRLLFPCQKRLIETAVNAAERPENLQALIDCFLHELTDDSKENFCKAIEHFAPDVEWDVLLSAFQKDVEMAWFPRVHAISEW